MSASAGTPWQPELLLRKNRSSSWRKGRKDSGQRADKERPELPLIFWGKEGTRVGEKGRNYKYWQRANCYAFILYAVRTRYPGLGHCQTFSKQLGGEGRKLTRMELMAWSRCPWRARGSTVGTSMIVWASLIRTVWKECSFRIDIIPRPSKSRGISGRHLETGHTLLYRDIQEYMALRYERSKTEWIHPSRSFPGCWSGSLFAVLRFW